MTNPEIEIAVSEIVSTTGDDPAPYVALAKRAGDYAPEVLDILREDAEARNALQLENARG